MLFIGIYTNFFLYFFLSLTFTFIIMILFDLKLKFHVSEPKGPQFIHEGKISRFGGLSIFLTFFIASILDLYEQNELTNSFVLYFVISIPVFVFGFLEDITQSVAPKLRLIGSLLSGILFLIIFDRTITSVGIGLLDFILNYKLISSIFTILCIILLIQAFNIIDGLNGLSLSTAILSLLAICIIAYEFKETEIIKISLCLISIFLGVFIFNFPFGKVFLGDGGAYLIGLYISIVLIILVEKNQNVLPFVVAQILIYPVYETIRSLIRRFLSSEDSVFKSDTKHLHSILYRYNSDKLALKSLKINFITSLQIILLQIINIIYVIVFYKDEKMIILGIIIFISFYEIFYNFINKRTIGFILGK